MGSFTPQNAEGLGVPWGKAMFNLPRYQMPGSTVGFGGGFGLSGDMQGAPGQSQMGMQPGANIGNVRFSMTRQASSDPVQNIINDVQNPLGGMKLGFEGGGGGGGGGLKERMMQPGMSANPYSMAEPMTGFSIGTPNFQDMAFPSSSPQQSGFTVGTPNFQSIARSPFNLKSRMLQNPISGPAFM
jgi:hypothetical protein